MDAPSASGDCRTIIDQLLALTFNLVQVDNQERPTEPVGMASGFVIEKDGKQYFITAGHVARNGTWMWECGLDRVEGCLLVPMGPFMLFSAGTLTATGVLEIDRGPVRSADFAWAPFEPNVIAQKLATFKGPKQPLPFEYYCGPLDRSLAPGETCVLATRSRGKIEKLRLTYLHRDVCVQDLVLKSTNKKGHHVFKPVGGHQGHEFYRGASGAPISNGEGVIVSILIGGNDLGDEIYGQPFPVVAHFAGFDPLGS